MKRILTALMLWALALPVAAAELGDDGLHKADWMRATFKDLREDLAEANAEDKRLMVILEQRGCIYCAKMHEEVFPTEPINSYIHDRFFVVQMNIYGDTEITDLDGETLTEKQAAQKWGMLFTPSILFLPKVVPEGQSAAQAAVAVMPGAFAKGTTLDMLTWVAEERYAGDNAEEFQRYHARMIAQRDAAETD